MDVGHLPAWRGPEGVLVRGRPRHQQTRHHRRPLHHGQAQEGVCWLLSRIIFTKTSYSSFLSRQFTVRVGEWNLADNDNYSEELQVNINEIWPEFIDTNSYYTIGRASSGTSELQAKRFLQ